MQIDGMQLLRLFLQAGSMSIRTAYPGAYTLTKLNF